MRLAIVSDIHGNLVALEAVLADLRTRGADLVVNLGDCVTSPLWPKETLALLTTLGWPTVRGNHDRWLAEDPPSDVSSQRSIEYCRESLSDAARAKLGALPQKIDLEGGVHAVHGTDESDTSYLLEDAVDGRLALVSQKELALRVDSPTATLVLCGHSHQQHGAFASATTLVLNPGSVGCPRSADHPAMARVEAGGPLARYAVATRARDNWTVEMIALSYDWSPVVERAHANDRQDWAEGFLGIF